MKRKRERSDWRATGVGHGMQAGNKGSKEDRASASDQGERLLPFHCIAATHCHAAEGRGETAFFLSHSPVIRLMPRLPVLASE